jgi:hypothetical protein
LAQGFRGLGLSVLGSVALGLWQNSIPWWKDVAEEAYSLIMVAMKQTERQEGAGVPISPSKTHFIDLTSCHEYPFPKGSTTS